MTDTYTPAPLSFNVQSNTEQSAVVSKATSTRVVVRPPDIDYESAIASPMTTLATVPSNAIANIKTADAGELGDQLNSLIGLARKLDPAKLGKRTVFKRVAEMLGGAKHNILAEYNTVDQQISQVVGLLHGSQAKYRARSDELRSMYDDIESAHSTMELTLRSLQAHAEDMGRYIQTITDPTELQAESRRLERCEMQIDTALKVMQLAKLSAQRISDSIANIQMLSDRMRSIESVTIPAWKGALYDYIIQQEMRTGAELGDAIADSTEEALLKQSASHKENATIIGRSVRRSVVSIGTITTMHENFVDALKAATTEAAAARAQREADSKQLQLLEAQLLNNVVPLPTKKG